MIIALCGSLAFYKEMRLVERDLLSLGHRVFVPKSLDLIEKEGFMKPKTVDERLRAEEKYDFIRQHFSTIKKADAILVVNPEHRGIKGYIGGNTFLEMGVAFFLGKIIYLLYPIPKMDYELELAAMHPVILDGNLHAL